MGVLYNLRERRGRIQIEIDESEEDIVTMETTTLQEIEDTTTQMTSISTQDATAFTTDLTSTSTLPVPEQTDDHVTTLPTTAVTIETSTTAQGSDKDLEKDSLHHYPNHVDTLELALATSACM